MMEEDSQIIENTVAGLAADFMGGSTCGKDQAAINALNLAHSNCKYSQLLAVIEEMGRDLRPSYAGSKTSAERLKRGIVHARILVRECLLETEASARQ